MSSQALLNTDLKHYFPLVAKGKVRDIYKVDDDTLLFCTTDRISAYDVNLVNGIPQKGAMLTLMSTHWFKVLSSKIPGLHTHFLTLALPEAIASLDLAAAYNNRSMQVRKLEVLPIESIVRGYISGSAWSSYIKTGLVNDLQMPAGLQESQKLEKPLWTPSTKAEAGAKDENISPQKAAEIVGSDVAQRVETLSLEIYAAARDYANERGIIIADTKFEFGIDRATSEIYLIDEVLTPDSSRFWPADKYEIGKSQPSLDKQYLRDWLTSSGLKGKEGVEMPPEVVQHTFDGYKKAFESLVGKSWQETLSSGLP